MIARELAIMAFSGTLPKECGDVSILDVNQAMASIKAVLPLKTIMAEATNQKDDHPAVRQLSAVEAPLRAIGSKLAPSMSPAQGDAWLDGVLVSLGAYPSKTVMRAARRAAEERFQYGLGSVDNRLHELCEEIDAANKVALYRLDKMRKEIQRASQPKIEQQAQEPMTIEELAALPDALWSLGVSAGFIAGEEKDQAEALRAEKSKVAIDPVENDAHTDASEGKTVGSFLDGEGSNPNIPEGRAA